MSNFQRKRKTSKARGYLTRRHFSIGLRDYRAGLGYRPEYNTWSHNEQLTYERGRQFAAEFPGFETVRDGRRICDQAEWALQKAIASKAIL